MTDSTYNLHYSFSPVEYWRTNQNGKETLNLIIDTLNNSECGTYKIKSTEIATKKEKHTYTIWFNSQSSYTLTSHFIDVIIEER